MAGELRSLVLVTGLSGAGKSTALRALEDLGFYCVDNLPVALLAQFAEQMQSRPEVYPRVALGIDVRSADRDFDEIPGWLKNQQADGRICQLLFIHADRKVLLKRYSETRRRHPLTSAETPLPQALEHEEAMLDGLRGKADWVIDASDTNIHQLRRQVRKCITDEESPMKVVLESFAFKHGVPQDVDFVFDARNLPNPHWEPALRPLSGRDEPVSEWLAGHPQVQAMADDIHTFLRRWLPGFMEIERSFGWL